MTIFKYTLTAYPTQHFIRKGAQFLCLQVQHDQPQMWFLCPTNTEETEQRTFVIRPTGYSFTPAEKERYLGTFQLNNGQLVFHVFEQLL